MYAENSATCERRFGIGPEVEVGAARRLWEEGGSYDRVAEGGNPVEDGMKVGSKRRRRTRAQGRVSDIGRPEAAQGCACWTPAPKKPGADRS